MLMTTWETVAGREITETLGVVTANSVRARNIGRDVLAGFRSIAGGPIEAYRELLSESREEALARLTTEARAMEADAIVCVRISTSSIMQGAAEVLAYGTAVKLR